MFVGAIKKMQKSMFPVFCFAEIAPGRHAIGVAGTAFFIDDKGTFATVAHIFDSKTPQNKYYYWGLLPDELSLQPIEIQEILRDDDKDVFIGSVAIEKSESCVISTDVADVGRTVCIAGYPLSVITGNAQGGAELGQVRRYFQPSFILDHADIPVNALTKQRVHSGYLMRDVGLFGMSGGPVFDIDGVIIGMQGSITPPRTSTNGDRTVTIENAVVIKSSFIHELIEKIPKKD